jgi:hypothetical protein
MEDFDVDIVFCIILAIVFFQNRGLNDLKPTGFMDDFDGCPYFRRHPFWSHASC